MNILFAYEKTNRFAAIRYAVELAFSFTAARLVFIDYSEILKHSEIQLLISYGGKKPKSKNRLHIHIYESHFFGQDFLTPKSLPEIPLKKYNGLPIIYSNDGELVLRDQNSIKTNIDLIASIFFMASRYEEFVLTKRDEFGRFQGENSLAFKENFLQRPVVDEYIRLLYGWIQELGVIIAENKVDKEYDFIICLTHDIDQISGGMKESIFYELSFASNPLRAIRETGKIFYNRIIHGDPYWNLNQIINLEEQHGGRSTFFFLPKTGNRKDAQYDFRSSKFLPIFERMKKGGWEIGLHGSLNSVINGDTLTFEKNRLEKAVGKVDGVRQHFLRFNVCDSWQKQQQAGFIYDTSLGFADAIGFRAGVARPFCPYDFHAERPFDIIEVPLVIMDTTLRLYEKCPPEKLWERMLVVLESVKQHRGAVAVLWHNTYFTGRKFAGYKKAYEQMLQWVNDCGGKLTTVQNVVELVKAKR